MSDHDQVKMTDMNYDNGPAQGGEPRQDHGPEPARRPPVPVCHPRPHRGHDPGGRNDGPGGLLGGGDLGRRHLRHHAPLSQRRPLGAHPHPEALFQEDPLFHAAARPEPGGLPQLRRRRGQRLHGPLLRKRHGHLPHLRRPQRLPQFRDRGAQDQGVRQALPGLHLLHADRTAPGRRGLQPGLLCEQGQGPGGHGRRLHLHQGHGRPDRPLRRLCHRQGDQGGGQAAHPPAQPLHLGHVPHEPPQGHRGGGGHHRHLS
jgi:hypothetical protein